MITKILNEFRNRRGVVTVEHRSGGGCGCYKVKTVSYRLFNNEAACRRYFDTEVDRLNGKKTAQNEEIEGRCDDVFMFGDPQQEQQQAEEMADKLTATMSGDESPATDTGEYQRQNGWSDGSGTTIIGSR